MWILSESRLGTSSETRPKQTSDMTTSSQSEMRVPDRLSPEHVTNQARVCIESETQWHLPCRTQWRELSSSITKLRGQLSEEGLKAHIQGGQPTSRKKSSSGTDKQTLGMLSSRTFDDRKRNSMSRCTKTQPFHSLRNPSLKMTLSSEFRNESTRISA